MEPHKGDAYNYYVENIGDKEIFVKEYRKDHIAKTVLEVYHTLHHYMSKKEKKVYFGERFLDGQTIDTRTIKILDLDPQWVYEANDRESKQRTFITNPTYIPGKTLQEYEDQLWKNTIQCICDAITKYIETITKVNFTDMYGVVPINVKVHIKDGNAELIVTDISCNIRNFFYSGKNAVILDGLLHQA